MRSALKAYAKVSRNRALNTWRYVSKTVLCNSTSLVKVQINQTFLTALFQGHVTGRLSIKNMQGHQKLFDQ